MTILAAKVGGTDWLLKTAQNAASAAKAYLDMELQLKSHVAVVEDGMSDGDDEHLMHSDEDDRRPSSHLPHEKASRKGPGVVYISRIPPHLVCKCHSYSIYRKVPLPLV